MSTPTFGGVLWGGGNGTPGGVAPATPGASVVSDILYAALRIAGVLGGAGHGPSPSMYRDAIASLNRMLATWSINRIDVFSIAINAWPLQAAKQTYTIGPGGDFDGPRPNRIDQANLILTNSGQPLRQPMQILTPVEWAAIKLQSLTSPIPTAIYNDAAAPLATLYLYPVPAAANQIELFTWQALTRFANVTDSFVFPDGYEEAIIYNLAHRVSAMWRTTMTPEAIAIAFESKANIESLNEPLAIMRCEDAYTGVGYSGNFNYLTGEPW